MIKKTSSVFRNKLILDSSLNYNLNYTNSINGFRNLKVKLFYPAYFHTN